MEKTEQKTPDVLDHIKKAEKAIKTNLLIKQMGTLKSLARELLEIKERSVMILEDVGVEEVDIKRVIDFINSSPEVQLTESDKRELREKVRREGKSKRSDVQREMEQHPFLGNFTPGYGNFSTLTTASGSNDMVYAVNTASTTASVNGGTSVTVNNGAGDTLNIDI